MAIPQLKIKRRPIVLTNGQINQTIFGIKSPRPMLFLHIFHRSLFHCSLKMPKTSLFIVLLSLTFFHKICPKIISDDGGEAAIFEEEKETEEQMEETEQNDVRMSNSIGKPQQRSGGKISEESAERILIKVLRQSGFQTEEEINEALAMLRPIKKVKREEDKSGEKRQRQKREGRDGTFQIIGEREWEMKLRVEPRLRNVTETPADDDAQDRKMEQKRNAVARREEKNGTTEAEEARNVPKMVPKPWW